MAIAVVGLAASGVFTSWNVRPHAPLGGRPQLVEVAKFQVNTIIALVLAEFGFLLMWVDGFISGQMTMMYLFAGLTLGVYLFIILPSGLAYWREWEEQGRPE